MTPKYIQLNSNGKEIANMFYSLDNLMFLAEHYPQAKQVNTTKREVNYEI